MENRRDKNQTHDTKGEAQNVNIDPENANNLGGNDKDTAHARSKATEGIRQQRDDRIGSSNQNRDRLNDITGTE